MLWKSFGRKGRHSTRPGRRASGYPQMNLGAPAGCSCLCPQVVDHKALFAVIAGSPPSREQVRFAETRAAGRLAAQAPAERSRRGHHRHRKVLGRNRSRPPSGKLTVGGKRSLKPAAPATTGSLVRMKTRWRPVINAPRRAKRLATSSRRQLIAPGRRRMLGRLRALGRFPALPAASRVSQRLRGSPPAWPARRRGGICPSSVRLST